MSLFSGKSKLVSSARKIARAGGFVTVTAGLMPPFYVRSKTAEASKQSEVRDRWVGRWSSLLLSLFSIELEIDGVVPPKSSQLGRLVVCNHRSAIDIGILLRVVGGKMVARADMAGWPVIGSAARMVGTIFVDRKSTQSGVAAIRTIQSELLAGETVNMFPEGTTFPDDPIRPFHRGGFVAARAAKAEILPIGVAYEKGSPAQFFNETFLAHLSRMSASEKPTRVVISIGEPYATTSNAATLTRKAEQEVSRLIARARERVDRPR